MGSNHGGRNKKGRLKGWRKPPKHRKSEGTKGPPGWLKSSSNSLRSEVGSKGSSNVYSNDGLFTNSFIRGNQSYERLRQAVRNASPGTPDYRIGHDVESGPSFKSVMSNSHFPTPEQCGVRWTATESSEPPHRDENHHDEKIAVKEKAPTLVDALIRQAFSPEFVKTCDPDNRFRNMLAKSRKFILNKEMSAFLADLASAPIDNVKPDVAAKVINGWRKLARSPHHITWIEYDHNAKEDRTIEAYPHLLDSAPGDNVRPYKVGWLIHQDHDLPIYTAIVCVSVAYDKHGRLFGQATPSVFEMCWSTEDDVPLPWLEEIGIVENGEIATAAKKNAVVHTVAQILTGWRSFTAPVNTVGLRLNTYMPVETCMRVCNDSQYNPLNELQGDLRYLWALMAAINDVPTSVEHVTATKGFVARGQYRRFSDHSIIKLNVPQKHYRAVAKKVGAAVGRRAHDVRGHWRKDFRKPLSNLCGGHDWESISGNGENPTLRCKNCKGEKFWVKEHTRGDASLGFVLHDYNVTHDPDKPNPETPERP